MKKAVFLDRDGVINRVILREGKPFPPANKDELEILSGVQDAIDDLRQAGYMIIVITNQPDVSRGITTIALVEEMHQYLKGNLKVDQFYVCYHDNGDNCDCRKPKPGALLAAAEKHGIDLAASYMIGDRWRDTEAGNRAGCKTIFIDYGYKEKKPVSYDYSVKSLKEASLIIIGETRHETD
ncbi:HAD family hydrolase [bacterium]|nr:HAD family hydrolase [bacterium]